MYGIKVRTRVLIAALIAALVLTMSMVIPPVSGSPDTQAYAAGTITLNVALTGAKANDDAYLYALNDANKSYEHVDFTSYDPVTKVFSFTIDAKYNGRKATIQYENNGYAAGATNPSRAGYGNIPSQFIGGYFGDNANDYYNYKTNISTFNIAAGTRTIALKKASYVTLKVTPGDTGDYSNKEKAYTSTYGYAYLVTTNKGGAVSYVAVSSINAGNVYNPTTGAIASYGFSNPLTGTYVFPALAGQKLIFLARGEFSKGAKKANGSLATNYYQYQWLGGYKGYSIEGKPKNLKTVTVGAANKSAGTIKLAVAGTAQITGTASFLGNNDDAPYVSGITTDGRSVTSNRDRETSLPRLRRNTTRITQTAQALL